MNTLPVLHAEAYAKPRTHRVAKAKVSRETKTKPKQPTVAELRLLCQAQGLKTTTKHLKAELMLMLSLGQYIKPAAYAKRKAKAVA